ncbi:MAG: site-specific integrase [Actinomycetota bacterium]|nr:site-specific integrase [Actinomycetota bacterium]
MQVTQARPVSGHVFRAQRKSGPVWFAKYRLPDGRQVQKRIGPAWTGRGRPAAGCFTRRTAQDWLRAVLDEARAGMLAGMARTGVSFERAAREWLRYCAEDRGCKPSTLGDYRTCVQAHLLPAFGSMAIDDVSTAAIEAWRARPACSPRTRNKLLTVLNGIFRRAQRAFGLSANPVAGIERLREQPKIDLEVFSPEEVWALVRAAACQQDATIFLTAAFTGLRRGELVALRWRDIDFAGELIRVRASYAGAALTTPKSGKVRSVPMAPAVAEALAALATDRPRTGPDDLVFRGDPGSFLDASALRRRYVEALQRAGLRRLRFHDLRHTFGTRTIAKADILRVKEWMGHADVATTMRYLHYAPRPGDARLVAEAFEVAGVMPVSLSVSGRDVHGHRPARCTGDLSP